MSWTDFEHTIWKKLKTYSLEDHDQFILAVSGGLDSMVLLHAMLKLKPQAQFSVAHYHHGESSDQAVQNYRDQALELVKSSVEKLSVLHNISFVADKSDEKLTSENDFRNARIVFFKKIQKDYPRAILTTAHHKDDLLETWLLKMIRGVGPQGLENFKFWNHHVLRPLLDFTKTQLEAYATEQGLVWLDDPSNQQNDYLRNWLRNNWLVALQNKQPGSIANLTDSLQRLIEEINPTSHAISINYDSNAVGAATKGWILRAEFMALSHSDQLKTLASVLKRIGQRSFSQGQLEEIIKRLDKNQKEIIFSIASVNWVINAEQIVVSLQ